MRALPKKEIIKKIVVDTAIPEDVISDVLSFAFSKAVKAFKTGDSVELSGFGKFVFNPHSAKKYLPQLEKGLINMERLKQEHIQFPKYVEYIDIRIAQKKEAINDIKRRINDKLEICS